MIAFWYWWIAAGVLLIAEMLAPGFFMLPLGVAAFAAGIVVYFLPQLGLERELVLFGVFALVAVLAWRRWLGARPAAPGAGLDRRAEQYVQRVFTLTEPLVNGYGRAAVDDGSWMVRGDEELPAGAKVRCVGVDGTVLVVRSAGQR